MKSKKFKLGDLRLVVKCNILDAAYIVPGATVWLRSGSPPMTVVFVDGKNVTTKWKIGAWNYAAVFSIACLTPELTPVAKPFPPATTKENP